VVTRQDLSTETQALIKSVKGIRGPRGLVVEECNLADWAYRTLRPYVDEIIVCDPRHNRLVAQGDKDDSVDPGKLCELYRLNGLRGVHHPQQRKALDLRRWVWLYHDQVELVVAAKNKLKAMYRYHGIRYGRRDVYRRKEREAFLKELPSRASRQQMEQLYKNLDVVEEDYWKLNARLDRMARRHPVVKTFLKIPGYGPIYALTFYTIVDTPWRFKDIGKLWAYGGLGIQRRKTGKAKPGKPQSNGPEHLNWPCNFRLKNVAMGVATVAITKAHKNPFSDTYERLVSQGVSPANAKSTVARKALRVPWAMWKRGEPYRADLAR
jgi:transposase